MFDVVHKWICLNELYILMGSFFQISNSFSIFGKPIFFQKTSEAWILIKLQCFVYKWIRLDEFYKIKKNCFQISFQNFGRKPKNIQTNREAWILIKVKCIAMHQCIWLDKLYKLMWIFFPILELLFELVTIFKIILALGLCKRGGGGICAEKHAF